MELFVQAEPAALAEWHLGRIEWVDALRAERIRVLGPAPRPGAPDLEPPQPRRASSRWLSGFRAVDGDGE